MFGAMTIAWVLKGLLLSAGGPAQLYDLQRYLAAKDPRDAAKIALLWPFFQSVRWLMVMAITLLALKCRLSRYRASLASTRRPHASGR